MAKVINDTVGKFCHHYPRVAAVVTAQAKGRENCMAVAWHMPVSLSPPLYGISVSPKRFTYQLIVDSKEFGINFLPLELAEMVASVGGSSGEEIDKFQRFNIAKEKSAKTAAPILEAAYAAYECKLVDDRSYGGQRLLVGEIVAVHLLEEVFTPEEVLDLGKVNPTLYMGRDFYATASKDIIKKLDRKAYGKR